MSRLVPLFLLGALLTGCGESPVESTENANQVADAVEPAAKKRLLLKQKLLLKKSKIT